MRWPRIVEVKRRADGTIWLELDCGHSRQADLHAAEERGLEWFRGKRFPCHKHCVGKDHEPPRAA
jgi:hypothetical protein